MPLKTINLRSVSHLLALFAVCAVFIIVLFFFARWSFGNSIATQVAQREVAEFAVDLAPSDPQTHYALAVLNEKTFVAEDLEKSLAEYEAATALAPYDYRLWLNLGKARERVGNAVGAEAAFKKALELAPNYAQIHWALGNFLLRQGRTEQAFEEILKAAENNETYLKPAISTAWTAFQGNPEEIRKHFGNSAVLNAMLATSLAQEKRFAEALNIWNSISSDDKKNRFKDEGKALFEKMTAEKKYRDALEIYKQIADETDEKFEAERIFNGGFERDVKPKDAKIFDWQLGSEIQPQVGFDEKYKSEGNRSIVMVFNSIDGRDFRNLSQMVVVQSDKTYEFSFYYKSELKTDTTFRWQILDSANDILAESENLSAKADWTNVSLKFTTSPQAESINIRLIRVPCTQGICPIAGKIRFDDFQLK